MHSSSLCCSQGWSRPLLAFGLIKSLQIISRHNQKTEYRKLFQWRSILHLKLFNVGDSITSYGRPFHISTVRKPKKFALSFVLQYLFWIFKQWPLVSDVFSPNGRTLLPYSGVQLRHFVWCVRPKRNVHVHLHLFVLKKQDILYSDKTV